MKVTDMTEEEKTVFNSAMVQYIRREEDTEKIRVALGIMADVADMEDIEGIEE